MTLTKSQNKKRNFFLCKVHRHTCSIYFYALIYSLKLCKVESPRFLESPLHEQQLIWLQQAFKPLEVSKPLNNLL